MKNIIKLAEELGIPTDKIIPYGWDKAKIDLKYMSQLKDKKDGKLVLVTAITPTKAGEGKTTTTIGLHDGFHKLGINSLACLREPSLGPVWGIKGGAVGALKSTIVPSDDINLHFTGDMHALTSTINLMASIIDNHIWQGNELNIDPRTITWTRAVDLNDRALRTITHNSSGTDDYVVATDIDRTNFKKMSYKSDFTITVASELMTILCLAKTPDEFIERVNNIIVAYTYPKKPDYVSKLLPIEAAEQQFGPRMPVRFGEFNCSKAIYKMMKNALNPNLVQTLEENPVFVHGGPFANISIGVNSLVATKMALKLAEVVVTEAGFGADLGAEKFLDIACQEGGLRPDCIVLVATCRALKLHGGVEFDNLDKENCLAIEKGYCNLWAHYCNLKQFGIPVIVAINKFPNDTEEEINTLAAMLLRDKIAYSLNTAALDGSAGSKDLAELVMKKLNTESLYRPLYKNKISGSRENNAGVKLYTIKEKIYTICTKIYGATEIKYSEDANKKIKQYEEMGYTSAYICISKTPNSFTDNPKILGAPKGHIIHIRDVKLYAGANLVVPLSGDLMLLPGLPKEPRCLDKFN